MAYRRKYKPRKGGKRRVFKRRTYRKRGVKRFGNSHSKGPFPQNMYTKLVYHDTVVLTSTASSLATQSYRLNSIYDPDLTGTGAQPRYYDTLFGPDGGNTPYGQYRVYGAKFKATLINQNSSPTTSGAFFCHWRLSTATALTTIDEAEELPNTILRDMNTGNAPGGICKIKKYVPMAPILGHKDLKDVDDSAAVYNANPVDQVYLDVNYIPYNALIDTTVNVRIRITYYVQCFDLNTPTQS